MTDQYITNAANGIGNPDPTSLLDITVEQIMAERGIGKRHAYTVLKDLKQEAYEAAPIPTNQRDRVLSALYRHKITLRTSRELVKVLQDEDYAIDGHDAVKVLWSLQKTGHVKFRERQHPKYLYAIKLTTQGLNDGQLLYLYGTTDLTPAMALEDPAVISLPPEVAEVPVPEEPTVDETVYALERGTLVTPFDDSLGGWPAIRAIRDRARRALKLASAAKILEEVGEDEMALTLMTQTEFTPLEEEVIELLKTYDKF